MGPANFDYASRSPEVEFLFPKKRRLQALGRFKVLFHRLLAMDRKGEPGRVAQ